MDVPALTELILSLPGVKQAQSESGADFSVGGRIIANLTPEGALLLKLSPDQQLDVTGSDAQLFAPVAGSWGVRGWTEAHAARLDEPSALSALLMAWAHSAH